MTCSSRESVLSILSSNRIEKTPASSMRSRCKLISDTSGIGLSATQRPIETVSRLLVGAGPERSEPDGGPRCSVVDEGHQRELDLALELPEGDPTRLHSLPPCSPLSRADGEGRCSRRRHSVAARTSQRQRLAFERNGDTADTQRRPAGNDFSPSPDH